MSAPPSGPKSLEELLFGQPDEDLMTCIVPTKVRDEVNEDGCCQPDENLVPCMKLMKQMLSAR